MSLPLLTAKLSVVGKIMCFSSLTEFSTRSVALSYFSNLVFQNKSYIFILGFQKHIASILL